MKKYLIIGFILLFALVFLLSPLLKGNEGATNEDAPMPAAFSFKDNLATKWNETIDLDILINQQDIEKLELIYNDSTFSTWLKPKKRIQCNFNAGFYGLGTRSLRLLATLKDGSTFLDERMVRVLSDVIPEIWTIETVNVYPHSPTSFTQGLEFDGNQLYEGTGQRGASMVAQVDLTSGQAIKKIGLDGSYFGEGITIFGDEVFQLTWQEQKCFIYNKKTLELKKDLPYVGEGWGLCNDGASLIMSDGTERITFRDPKTFQIQRTIEVFSHLGPVANLNELEYIDELIYANVWMTNKIAVIDPRNGKVLAEIDATSLVKEGKGKGDVLNGIASNNGKIYLTGKNWIKLFEVKLRKLADV